MRKRLGTKDDLAIGCVLWLARLPNFNLTNEYVDVLSDFSRKGLPSNNPDFWSLSTHNCNSWTKRT